MSDSIESIAVVVVFIAIVILAAIMGIFYKLNRAQAEWLNDPENPPFLPHHTPSRTILLMSYIIFRDIELTVAACHARAPVDVPNEIPNLSESSSPESVAHSPVGDMLSVVNLDRVEKSRRNHEMADFDDLVNKYTGDPNGRTKILIEWKNRRIRNYNKAFGVLPAVPAHSILADESLLSKDKGLKMESKPFTSGRFSHLYAAKIVSGKKTMDNVVVKVIKKSDFIQQFYITNIDRQLRILLMLSHPHLVRLFDVYEIRGKDKILMLMQRAKMGSLDHLVRKEGAVRETPLAKKWTRDVIYATDYLHNLGIAHRRICPSHVLIQSPNHAAKLMAPDAFAEVRSEKNTGSFRSEFGSPETIFGTMFDAFPADIWSIGCTAYFMLTTKVPFQDHTNLERMKQQLNEKSWKNHPDLSGEAADFLINLLHGTVDKRSTTAELLASPWVMSLAKAKATASTPNLGGPMSDADKSEAGSTGSSGSLPGSDPFAHMFK